METKRGDTHRAHQIFRASIVRCNDAASVYHGLAKLELSLGNVENARSVLRDGMEEARLYDGTMDGDRRRRAVFLAHTLGTLELNGNRPAVAKKMFETGIERYATSSQLFLGAALCEAKMGKEEEDWRLFGQSVDVDRRHAHAWQS